MTAVYTGLCAVPAPPWGSWGWATCQGSGRTCLEVLSWVDFRPNFSFFWLAVRYMKVQFHVTQPRKLGDHFLTRVSTLVPPWPHLGMPHTLGRAQMCLRRHQCCFSTQELVPQLALRYILSVRATCQNVTFLTENRCVCST